MGEKHLLNRKEEAPAGSRGCHVETTATLLTSEYGYFLSADQMEADAVGAALAGGVDWEEGTKGSDYGGAMDPDYPKTGESFEGGVEPGLDLSEGEAFFVLEDMFGGLLPPSVLERVFVESGQDLEEVCEGEGVVFHYCTSFIHSLVGSLVRLVLYQLVHLFVRVLFYSFRYLVGSIFMRSLVHLFVRSFNS